MSDPEISAIVNQLTWPIIQEDYNVSCPESFT